MNRPKQIAICGIINSLLSLKYDEYTTALGVSVNIGYSLSAVESFIKRLKEADLIEVRRGPNGGYALTRPLNDIYIRDIIPLVGQRQKATKVALTKLKDDPLVSVFTTLL